MEREEIGLNEARDFAIHYNNLQRLLLKSEVMKIEYQRAISFAIDILKVFGEEEHNLIFDGDRINWESSFPENFQGNRKDLEQWLEDKK